MIRLIASDIDGTLLQNGKRELNPELFQLIEQFYEKGILFCAASGRQYPPLRRLFEPVADKIAFMSENGGFVCYQDKEIAVHPMPLKESLQVIDDISAQAGCEVQVSGKKQVYLSPRNPRFIKHIQEFVKNQVVLVKDFSKISEPFLKVSAMMMEGVEQEVLEYFSGKWSDTFHVALAGSCWIDFTVSNKGQGLAALCQVLEIPLAETAAFGDNYNDIEMLQMAKYSWAMSQADDAIQQAAGRTCNRVEPVLQSILEALSKEKYI